MELAVTEQATLRDVGFRAEERRRKLSFKQKTNSGQQSGTRKQELPLNMKTKIEERIKNYERYLQSEPGVLMSDAPEYEALCANAYSDIKWLLGDNARLRMRLEWAANGLKRNNLWTPTAEKLIGKELQEATKNNEERTN